MSEYQYYEFQAIDRALTAGEMRELREVSSRARITSTSFVNDYAWGATKQAKSYDRAVELLVDLRDLAAKKKGGDFLLRLTAFRQVNERKPSFLERLRKVGL